MVPDNASKQNFLMAVEKLGFVYDQLAPKLEHGDGMMTPQHEQLLNQSVAKKHQVALLAQPYRSFVLKQKGHLAHHHGHKVQHLSSPG
jgi:hypothetical protein